MHLEACTGSAWRVCGGAGVGVASLRKEKETFFLVRGSFELGTDFLFGGRFVSAGVGKTEFDELGGRKELEGGDLACVAEEGLLR